MSFCQKKVVKNNYKKTCEKYHVSLTQAYYVPNSRFVQNNLIIGFSVRKLVLKAKITMSEGLSFRLQHSKLSFMTFCVFLQKHCKILDNFHRSI